MARGLKYMLPVLDVKILPEHEAHPRGHELGVRSRPNAKGVDGGFKRD